MMPSCNYTDPRHKMRQPPAVVYDDDKRRRDFEDAALKNVRLEHISKFVTTMSLLNPDWMTSNPELRIQTEGLLTDIMFRSNEPQTTTSISAVAREMGIVLQHDQLIKAGATVARLYRDRHCTEPPKRFAQWGDDLKVNVYTEADRDLIVVALKQLMGKADYGAAVE